MFLVNEFVDTFHGYEDQCNVTCDQHVINMNELDDTFNNGEIFSRYNAEEYYLNTKKDIMY
jgi:hypothetical protein